MTSYIQAWPRERRALRPTYTLAMYEYQKHMAWELVLGLTALFLALCFFVTVVFHFPVATAADAPDADQVHTIREACQYVKMHPGLITNEVQMKKKYCL